MRVRFILRFLLTLLVSILFSASTRFFVTSDYWSLHWGQTLNTGYASDSTQQDRLPVSLEVGRIYFY